jgi:hypothetical protein
MLWSADCRNYLLICGGYVNAGSETNEQLVIKAKILIKLKSYSAVANDSLPISISVKNNNYDQLVRFDIVAFSKDSANTVIDVSKFYVTLRLSVDYQPV